MALVLREPSGSAERPTARCVRGRAPRPGRRHALTRRAGRPRARAPARGGARCGVVGDGLDPAGDLVELTDLPVGRGRRRYRVVAVAHLLDAGTGLRNRA